MDPIPKSIKEHFFKGVEPPNLSKDYDAIGFDADHCFVKYNVKNLTFLLVKEILQDLHVKLGYPEEILDFDCSETSVDINLIQNSTLFDIDNGNLLKLGEDKEVLAALKGRKVLSKEEIMAVYGSPIPKYEPYQWPSMQNFRTPNAGDNSSNYYMINTHFETYIVGVILMCIQLQEDGKLEKGNMEIAGGIMKVANAQHHLLSDGIYTSLKDHTGFSQQILKNPSKYIQPQPEMRAVLKKLRDQGKFVFLGTNSYWEYADLIMEATLGKDWANNFDMVVSECNKPDFFKSEKQDQKLIKIDEQKQDFLGETIDNIDELSDQPGQNLYARGNSQQLESFVQKKLGKDEVKFAYFGDAYTSDIYWSSQKNNWDGILVLEELSQAKQEFEEIEQACDFMPMPMNLPDTSSSWGDYFIHDKEKPNKNYFLDKITQSARYAVPLVRHIPLLMD